MNIRNYKDSDYSDISSWYKEVKEDAPFKEQIPLESSSYWN